MGLGRFASGQKDPDAAKLAGEIDGWIRMVKGMFDELPEFDDPAAKKETYKAYKKEFSKVATTLTSYTKEKRQRFYSLFQRSQGSLKAANEVIKEANKTAGLFEGFYIKPASYRKAKSEFALNELLVSLQNLRGWLHA